MTSAHAEMATASVIRAFLRGHGLDMAIIGNQGDVAVVFFSGIRAVAAGEGVDAYAAFAKAAADFHYGDA